MDSAERDAEDPDGIECIPSCVMLWIPMESSRSQRELGSGSQWNPGDPLVGDALDPDGLQWISSIVIQWILMEFS